MTYLLKIHNLWLGNDRDRWDLRGQLLFNATDDLKFRLIADTSSIDQLCCGVQTC